MGETNIDQAFGRKPVHDQKKEDKINFEREPVCEGNPKNKFGDIIINVDGVETAIRHGNLTRNIRKQLKPTDSLKEAAIYSRKKNSHGYVVPLSNKTVDKIRIIGYKVWENIPDDVISKELYDEKKETWEDAMEMTDEEIQEEIAKGKHLDINYATREISFTEEEPYEIETDDEWKGHWTAIKERQELYKNHPYNPNDPESYEPPDEAELEEIEARILH